MHPVLKKYTFFHIAETKQQSGEDESNTASMLKLQQLKIEQTTQRAKEVPGYSNSVWQWMESL
eukprot:6175218-Pleurochrysis_carterae.AAC.1